MFEDSTFESNGKIKSKSGRWMVVHLHHQRLLSLVTMILYSAHLPRSVAESDDAGDVVGLRPAAAAAATTTATTG